MTLVVVIARFQVPQLHLGHQSLLKWAREQGDKLLVILGCSAELTSKNPIPYNQRSYMLRGWCDAITGLNDVPGDDLEWSNNVDSFVEHYKEWVWPDTDRVILVCGPDGFKPHYHGKYEVREFPSTHRSHSGTAIRKQIVDRPQDYNNESFRAGMIYAVNLMERNPQ